MNLHEFIEALGFEPGKTPAGRRDYNGRRWRSNREQKAALKRTKAREQRRKMKRHQRRSRKGRGHKC